MKRSAMPDVARRIAVFVLVNVVGLIVLLEVGARLVYPMVRPDPFTWAELRSNLLAQGRDEAVLVADPVAAPPGAPVPEIHPYLGYVMKPGSEQETRTGETLPFSEFGFFGETPLLNASSDDVVIAIAGGSVAASFWHHEADYLRERFAADPRYSGKTIHVQSYALGGFKQPQMLNSLAYLLTLGARVDVWIELDGFNDLVLPVAENLPVNVPLVYPRRWDRLTSSQTTPQEAANRFRLEQERTERENRRRRFAHAPLTYSAFALACWDTLDRRSEARITRLVHALTHEPANVNPPSGDPRDALQRAADIWKNASLQLARLCEANGIAYFQFVQPNQYFPDSKPFSDEERRNALAQGGYQPAAAQGYRYLMDATNELRADGVPIYDLTMLFANEPRTVYRDSCCHVNELGNQLMAEAIVSKILEADPNRDDE